MSVRGSINIPVTPTDGEIVTGSPANNDEANARAERVSAIAARLAEPKPAYETQEERDANNQ